MINNRNMKLVLGLLALLLSIPSIAQDNWELKRDKNEVKVYTKKKEGFSLKAYKGVTYTNFSPKQCSEILWDFENHHKWSYAVEKTKVLESTTNEKITHFFIDAPWPVNDRDIVIKATKVSSSDSKVIYKMSAIKNYLPDQSGYIRLNVSETTWTFEREGNKTKITYSGYSEAGGSIPDWLANSSVVDAPHETLMKFKDQLTR